MRSTSPDGLFNPYLGKYLGENERPAPITPRAMQYHVKTFLESGLTQIEYCRVNRISYSKLIYWLKKSRSEAKNVQTPGEAEPARYKFQGSQYLKLI